MTTAKCLRCNMRRKVCDSDFFGVVERHIPNWRDYNFCGPCHLIVWRMCGHFCDKGKHTDSTQMWENGPTRYNRTYNRDSFYSNKDQEINNNMKKCSHCRVGS